MTQEKSWKAKVTKVIQGRNPYAVAVADDISESVTFSLGSELKVWQEVTFPTAGDEVVLCDIRKKDKGWRAHEARFLRPEDENPKQLQQSA